MSDAAHHPPKNDRNDLESKATAEKARDLLELILGFFERADAKGNTVLGVGLGMVAFQAINTPAVAHWSLPLLLTLIPYALLAISLWHVYKSSFPRLDGGYDSVIYFREIAKRRESQFIEAFSKQSEESYTKDLLGQAWRNAEILRLKFDHLRHAHIFITGAIFPWLASLVAYAALNHRVDTLFVR